MPKKTIKTKPASRTIKTSRSKPVAKSTSRVANKAKVSAAKKPRKTSTVSKKTSQPKGLKHHAKRIYHLTPKFVHGMIAGAFVGIVVVTSLGISGGVYANPAALGCIKVTDGINVNSANANATVKLEKPCGVRKFVLKAYYAADASGGKRGPEQVLYATTSPPAEVRVAGGQAVKLHVNMFDESCFYQVDLVDVTDGDSADSGKNPIVKYAVGGKKDCRPDQTHSYACSVLTVSQGANRNATITDFQTATTNATFTGADVNWGDSSTASNVNPKGLTHQYAADGTYSVSVIAKFTYNGRFDGVHTVSAPACAGSVSFSTPPPVTPPTPATKYAYVCEISSKSILKIDEKLVGSAQYPNDKYTTDLSKCTVKKISVCEIATLKVVTINDSELGSATYPNDKYTTDLSKCVPATPPVTPPTQTPPATLANTGPGAVLVIFGLALLGGYAFHMRHRHVQHRKHARRHA